MAIKRRLNFYSGMRIDIPHLRSIESSVSNDFDELLRGMFIGLTTPYLIRGFKVIVPINPIQPQDLQMEVADSAVLHPTATESGTILYVPSDEDIFTFSITNPKIVGSFQDNQVNYIALDYKRSVDNSTIDQTAGWSQSQKLEYQRTSPLGKILDYQIVITTGGFGGQLPLYSVKVTSGLIQWIIKASNNLFRLGSGGAVPDPQHIYGWGPANTGNPSDPRREYVNPDTSLTPGTTNPLAIVPSASNEFAFDYGDFAITNMKEWMDAVMSRFREITASPYWYTSGSLVSPAPNMVDLWWDSVGSVMTGSGAISFNMIAEVGIPLIGAYQSKYVDSTIVIGDSYIEGQTSGTKATLSAFNLTELVINSLTQSGGFVYGEFIYNKRLFRPNLNNWQLSDIKSPTDTLGRLRRIGTPTYTIPVVSQTITLGSLITGVYTIELDFDASHTFEVGEHILVTGLTEGVDSDVSGTVVEITATGISFLMETLPTGTATACGRLIAERHPYIPRFAISSWSYVGTTITINAQGSNFNFAAGDKVLIQGLTATTNAPNGIFTVDASPTPTAGSFQITASLSPTGTAGVNSAYASYPTHSFELSVSGSSPDTYNVNKITAFAVSDSSLSYIIGDVLLPTIGNAAGAIKFDGVVASTNLLDPVVVQSLDNTTPDEVLVTTYTAHGLTSTSGVMFTIYGDQTLSELIRTYVNVDIVYLTPTTFILQNTGLSGLTTWTNTGSIPVFSKFNNNPYAGPIQWDSDILIKGIIGDKQFIIPQTAIADGTDFANQFNVGGLTGTAYVRDKEVAYIILERNESVSGGAPYTTAGGNSMITGIAPLDIHGNPLVIGDFVKFETESENYWLQISSIGVGVFYVKTDTGHEPTLAQRPAKSGRLVYCKKVYDVVHVAQHLDVPADANVYWLAVRRDFNNTNSKVYFRSLELEAGETRQINDNDNTNILAYIGSPNESATNPNYTLIDPTGPYSASEPVVVESYDILTKMVSFSAAPELGFKIGDLVDQGTIYTIKEVITSRSVIMKEDISAIAIGTAEYLRVNNNIDDSDSLTLALRKEDRTLADVETVLGRYVYDESVYIQKIKVLFDQTNVNPIRSGSYIYQGTETAPTSLAYVLHGTYDVSETIEGGPVTMPGGHSSLLEGTAWAIGTTYALGDVVTYLGVDYQSLQNGNLGNTPVGGIADTWWVKVGYILVNIVAGSWLDGDSVYQLGTNMATLENPSDPDFDSPSLAGGPSAGIELVLPPNKRTEVIAGGTYIKFGTPLAYHASTEDSLCGEELLVIVNDTIREANVDYVETYGGPKGKIRIKRTTPPNTRIRARLLTSYGSAVASKISGVSLQAAYDGGNTIAESIGRPVVVTGTTGITGDGALQINNGGIEIDCTNGGIATGGIKGVSDKSFKIGQEDNRSAEVWTAAEFVKTHNSYTGSYNKKFTAAQTVVGSSATVITGSKVTLQEGYAYRIKINATVRRQDLFGVSSFVTEGTFYREVSGEAILAGSPMSEIFGFAGDGINYAIEFAIVTEISTNDTICVVAYGDGTTHWAFTIEVQAVSTSS